MLSRLTWKTVSSAMGKVLKFVGGVPVSKLNWPPNSCMPSRANMRMNRKSRKRSEMMLRIEFSSDITRFLKLDQYLVTLKIRSRRRARRTENPKEPDLTADQMTSNIEPDMTTQSKRLKLDSKYIRGPRAYIFITISDMKSPRNTNSVTTVQHKIKVKSFSRWPYYNLVWENLYSQRKSVSQAGWP